MNALTAFHQAAFLWAERIGWTLLHSVWQITSVAALATGGAPQGNLEGPNGTIVSTAENSREFRYVAQPERPVTQRYRKIEAGLPGGLTRAQLLADIDPPSADPERAPRCSGKASCAILRSMSISSPQFESLPGFSPPSAMGPLRAASYWELPEGEPVELIQGRLSTPRNGNLIFSSIAPASLRSSRSAMTVMPLPAWRN